MVAPDLKQVIIASQEMVRRGDANGALAYLQSNAAQLSGHVDFHMNVAIAHRNLGNAPLAIKALNAALAIDPYAFMPMLSKGSILEQMGDMRTAAQVYKDVLRIAPEESQLHASLRPLLKRAQEVVDEQAKAMASHFRDALGPLMQEHRGESLTRFEECMDVVAGVKQIYNAEPVQVHYPRLPAIPFFDRSYFPWFETLEAATETIQGELETLMQEGLPGFKPYVQYAPGTPENQFKPLNHSDNWSSLWLWKDGQPQREAMARCPKTTAVLEELPLADQPDFAPTALFSALAPHTKIPPHTGSTNTRLLVHLPLVLPGPAGFRVGNETREWRIGEAWAFDDTIEHEAWNDADQTRVIMIFDIWNPLLSEAERSMISALLGTHRDWLAGAAS